MKIYTMVSKSHQFLHDEYFEKSIKKFEPEAEIISEQQRQVCSTGEYYSDGWKESMRQKIEIYDKAINTDDEFFIWSDVDIEFYSPFIKECIKELGDYDIAFQEGVGREYCAGFFICKINKKTKSFFKLLKEKYDLYACDQEAINKNIQRLNAKFLSDRFLNISFQHRHWSGQDFTISHQLIMFHANYTVGLQNKITLLDRIKKNNNNIIKRIKEINNIEIISAYYGCYEDVTEYIKNADLNIEVSTHRLNKDPMPGLFKNLYIFDKDKNLIVSAVPEGHVLFFND